MEEKRKRAFKTDRPMKVYETSGYKYSSTPQIHLQGLWLKEVGFEIGEPINIHCE